MTIDIIPTVVPKTLGDVLTAKNRYKNFTQSLHIDVGDGNLAPNKTWIPQKGETLDDESVLFEAHLMVSNPRDIGIAFVSAGAKRIIAHLEGFQNTAEIPEILDAYRKNGAIEVGLAMLLQTDLEAIAPFIAICDVVLLMTIARVGVQGIPFDSQGIERVARVHARFPTATLAVDGGVSERNIAILAKAGAERFCVGSMLAKSGDPEKTHAVLVELGKGAIQ